MRSIIVLWAEEVDSDRANVAVTSSCSTLLVKWEHDIEESKVEPAEECKEDIRSASAITKD